MTTNLRLVVDAPILDRLVSHPDTGARLRRAVDRGRLLPFAVPAVRDYLLAVPDEARRQDLVSLYDLMSAGSLSLRSASEGLTVQATDRGAIREALLAAATTLEVDVLVTEDGELALSVQRGEAGRCQVWSFADLVAALDRLEGQP